jgi:hypothetical protein
MALNHFALLINTTDSFEDCWIPFFTLFKKYWPEFNGTIYLNTETKSFTFDGLNIVATKNNLKRPQNKTTWSECLIRALDAIPDDIVLYMQEDYFLHDIVKSNLIDDFARLISTSNIGCIHLTDQATPGPFLPTSHKDLLEIDIKAPYRISTQAALWKNDILKEYIIKGESAWQFEQNGTKRAKILKHNLYNVDTNKFKKDKNEIIPYIFTGIIRGKWNSEVETLFSKNNIIIDYRKRGIYNEFNQNTFLNKFKLQLSEVCKKIFRNISFSIY